jgi:AcrR family transcriptional regulator
MSLAANETTKEELSAYSKAKRDQIIRGAVEVFLQYGYEGTSMNRVAERAGVIKQTIYSHFNDKEGLFTAIVESLTLAHVKDQFGGNFDMNMPPRQMLKTLAKVFSGRQKDASYVALLRTVIGESSRFPELARLYTEAVIRPGIKLFCEYFAKNPSPRIKDSEAIARIFCGTLVNHIMTQEILYGRDLFPFQMERLADTLIDLILA